MIDNPFFYHSYPYTNSHELNTDYLYYSIRALAEEMHNFEIVNNLEYCGLFDISKNYEKYSIVIDGNNNGYISIQPVPAGINLTNTDYWIEVANFTAQMADYGNRINALENDVAALDNVVGTFDSKITAKENKLTAGTKIYCVGNSFVWGSGGSPVPPSGDRGWAYYMAQLTGCTYERMCQNGGDFLATATAGATFPNKTYRQALTEYVGTKTAEELAAFDYVIFGGGYNDHQDALTNYSGLVSEIRTTIRYVKTNFPNAKIVLIPLMANTFKNNADAAIEDEYVAYMTAWTNAAVQEGCLTTTHSHEWTYKRTELAAGDNIHLNDDGYNRIARYMTAVINGWNGAFYGYYYISWANNVTPSYSLLMVNDGIVTLQAQISVTGTNLGNTQQVIGSISTADYLAPNKVSHYFAGYTYSTGHYDPFIMSIRTNGDIRIEYNTSNKPNDTTIYISTSWRAGY